MLIQEPHSVYVGHISPDSGTSVVIKDGIVEFCDSNGISMDELVAICCDGTNVNTGALGGVIRLLEVKLDRPLHWFICMLHANELPLTSMLKLDGTTSGPKAFSGPIGKAIQSCENLPVIKFTAIEGNIFPEVDFEDLSTDQKYMYKMCIAVTNVECPTNLALQTPGPVVHSRWLTTANRILRLYVATESPSSNLLVLATFVMKVYAPIWFYIKTQSSCTERARHLWRLINFSRYLPTDLRSIVDDVIQRNVYFSHYENIILAMLTDEHNHIRKLAYRRILAAQEENASTDTTLRRFRVHS